MASVMHPVKPAVASLHWSVDGVTAVRGVRLQDFWNRNTARTPAIGIVTMLG